MECFRLNSNEEASGEVPLYHTNKRHKGMILYCLAHYLSGLEHYALEMWAYNAAECEWCHLTDALHLLCTRKMVYNARYKVVEPVGYGPECPSSG